MLALLYILSFICGALSMFVLQLIIDLKNKNLKEKNSYFESYLDLLNY